MQDINEPLKKQKVEIAKISDILREVLPAQPEEYRQLIGQVPRTKHHFHARSESSRNHVHLRPLCAPSGPLKTRNFDGEVNVALASAANVDVQVGCINPVAATALDDSLSVMRLKPIEKPGGAFNRALTIEELNVFPFPCANCSSTIREAYERTGFAGLAGGIDPDADHTPASEDHRRES